MLKHWQHTRKEKQPKNIFKQRLLKRKTTVGLGVFLFLMASMWWKFVPTKKAGTYSNSTAIFYKKLTIKTLTKIKVNK